MIYLAIDTDVWLWLIIHGIDAEDNYFDEFCYWLESGQIRCIIPEQILIEWQRNKEQKIGYVKTELLKTSQLRKTASIKNEALFSSVYNADNFESLGRTRINKVEEIFEKCTDIATITDAIKLEAADRTLSRLAPNHAKDSFSDTVNILTILSQVRQQALSPVIFTTKNYKDYSDPKDKLKIHPELARFFEEVAMDYVHDTDYLFNKILRPQLPSFASYLAKRKQADEEAKNLATKQQKEQLSNSDEDFIGNSIMIDQILSLSRPTQVQFKIIADLIDNDPNCRKYFFEKVSRPVWFNFMDQQGFFDPANHPGPIDGPNGSYTSRWEPIGYLERLSEQIKNGVNEEILPALLDVVQKLSLYGIDNDLTHTALIRIISNLPNEFIASETLELLPAWFSSRTNKMFPSSAVCNHLLPKFLYPGATDEEIRKAEYILLFLLGTSKNGVEIDNTEEKTDTGYFANAYPWAVIDALVKKELLAIIAKRCSTDIFYHLADTLKKVLLDYPSGLNLPVIQSNIKMEIKIALESDDLLFSLTLPGTLKEFSRETLPNFGKFEKNELKDAIISILSKLGIRYEPIKENEDYLKGLVYALTVDRLSRAGAESIGEMDVNHAHSKHFRVGYGIILSKYLTAITEHNLTVGQDISLRLFYDQRYRLPFFRRIALHNISLHFKKLRSLLFDFLKQDDPHNLFNDYAYQSDLFILLRNNQVNINKTEAKRLLKIINAGPSDKGLMDAKEKLNWQFRWYLALKQVPSIAERYKEISENLGLKDTDADPTQKMRFRSGTVPPMTAEQLCELHDEAIINYLQTFNPKDRWEEPNISGLADILKAAAKSEPDRFVKLLPRCLGLPYIYVYNLLYALSESAQKKPLNFDWKILVVFCRDYISQKDFGESNRVLKNDSWEANSDWVLGVVANIVSETCKQDNYLRKFDLLSVCKELIRLMNLHFKVSEPKPPQHQDYLSHVVNADNGKFLRASMDYCLCDKRLNKGKEFKFDPFLKAIFDNAFANGAMDAFILLGWYWRHFNYIDHKWFTSKIKDLTRVDELFWKAFMGGFLFAAAPPNKRFLALFLPNYHRAVDEQLEIKTSGTNGLANHMVSLYFWGLVDLSENSVLTGYLRNMRPSAIESLLHTCFFSTEYIKSLKEDEMDELERKMIELVNLVNTHYLNSAQPDVLEMLRSTVNIVYLIPALNEANSRIIQRGVSLASRNYHNHDLFERLNELKNESDANKSAEHLAFILEAMPIQERQYMMESDQVIFKELLQFLYANGQKTVADTLCNRLSKSGLEFAKELYVSQNH